MGLITRGLSGSLITRGLSAAGPPLVIIREIIRLISKLTFLITRQSEIDTEISKTSIIELEIDDG